MSAEERAADERRVLAIEMRRTILNATGELPGPLLIEALVNDAMFPIEHLLAEVEMLRRTIAEQERHIKEHAVRVVAQAMGTVGEVRHE